MKSIASGVFLESNYPGVILGVLELPEGVVLIDAPPRPDDGRDWLANLMNLDSVSNRILVNLDSHPDRTLGTRVMDSTVLAHKATADKFKQRPAIFKAHSFESGSEWELCSGLSGIRWFHPNLVYSDQVQLHLGGTKVVVEHHAGPEEGASWVVLPELEIVFVGDAVITKQPPFLSNANLPAWIENLDILLSKEYASYKIISSRSEMVDEKAIKKMRSLIAETYKQLERIKKKSFDPALVDKLVDKLISASESPTRQKKTHSQRLRYGLRNYYTRVYFPEHTPNNY